MLTLYIAISVISLFLAVKMSRKIRIFWRNWKLLHKIPGPPERAIFGHIHILTMGASRLFDFLRSCSKTYYPIYRFSTPYIHIVNFLAPPDIEIILSTTKHLSKSKIYSFLENWLGTGLLTSTGLKWHKRRKILTPAFHFTILNEFLTVFNEETSSLLKNLDRITALDDAIDVVPPVTQFTLQSIAETAMGLTTLAESQKKDYKSAIFALTEIFLKRLMVPWFRVKQVYNLSKLAAEERKTVKALHEFSSMIIKEREATNNFQASVQDYSRKKRLAMLDLLLAAKRDGAEIDFEGIREEVDTFMFEGHDTTAMAISFLLLTLANLPQVQSKVYEEILGAIGDATPSFASLQELKYTERVIKETLRLFPSVPFISRTASEDFTTKTGYFIPEGTVLHIHIFDLHRNENIYQNALEFEPDRFLPENVRDRHPFAYIPFSAGPRNCIGQRFAILELKTVLCGVLRRFRLEKIDDMKDVVFKPDLVLRPTHPLRVKFTIREAKVL